MLRLWFLLFLLGDFAVANCFLGLSNQNKKSFGWRETTWTTARLHYDHADPENSRTSETNYMIYSKSLRLNAASANKEARKINVMVTDVISDSRNLENGTIEVKIDSDSKIKLKDLNEDEKARLQDILSMAASKVAKIIGEKKPGEVKKIKITFGSNTRDFMTSPPFNGQKFKGDPLGTGEEYNEAPIIGVAAGFLVTALYGAAHTINSGLGSGVHHATTIVLPAIAAGFSIFEAIRIYGHYRDRDYSIELPVGVESATPAGASVH
jgi:hypothetical protein